MANSSSTFIRIGGSLAAADLLDFLDTLVSEGIGPDGHRVSFDELTELIAEASCDLSCLELWAVDRGGGQFESLEPWLRQHGLTYYRYDDGCPGCWGAAGSFWRPGMDEPAGWAVDDVGRPLLCYSDVLMRAREEIDSLVALMREAAAFEIELRVEEEARLPAVVGGGDASPA